MQINLERESMRRKCAVALWIAALFVVVTSPRDVGTLFEWRELLLLLWVFGRAALFAYAGLLLWDAEDTIARLQHSNASLERIISDLQK